MIDHDWLAAARHRAWSYGGTVYPDSLVADLRRALDALSVACAPDAGPGRGSEPRGAGREARPAHPPAGRTP